MGKLLLGSNITFCTSRLQHWAILNAELGVNCAEALVDIGAWCLEVEGDLHPAKCMPDLPLTQKHWGPAALGLLLLYLMRIP